MIEKIKQLEEQKAEVTEEAKKKALAQALEAVEVLGALGYQYAIVREDKQKQGRSPRGMKKHIPDKPCTVYNFQTNPPHDARHHKSQVAKAPFTPEELEQKGLTRVISEPR